MANCERIPKAAKPFCTLPQQTVEGLRMCGKSYNNYSCNYIVNCKLNIAHALPEMARFLLSMDGVEYLYSERFNQEAVKIYFAQ